jgi:hypothetical protein
MAVLWYPGGQLLLLVQVVVMLLLMEGQRAFGVCAESQLATPRGVWS